MRSIAHLVAAFGVILVFGGGTLATSLLARAGVMRDDNPLLYILLMLIAFAGAAWAGWSGGKPGKRR